MDINVTSSPAAFTRSATASAKDSEPVLMKQQADSSVVSPQLETQQETQKVNDDQLKAVNSRLEALGIGLTFSVDENTQSSVVKIIDKTTDEVIKQFPSEGSLKIMQNIQNYLDLVNKSGMTAKEGLTGALLNEII
ncbi:MAG: flagellar protein FlaG [Campylobacterales bacterium]|nr:flagellar protein FlaG [Thiotrichales bacterium]MBD3793952.1 flagellar protein FlaG [Campylobacterales bacterium]